MTAKITDYATLKLAIGDFLYRADDADIDEKTSLFVSLAEARIRRDQEWFNQIYSLANGGTPLTVTANPTQLPPTVKQITAMWAATGLYKHDIEIVTLADWRDLAQTNFDAAGVPTKAVLVPSVLNLGGYLDNVGETAASTNGPMLFLWPQPSGTDGFAVDFNYVADVPELSDTATTTPLLRRHPDLYLYGALVESAPFYQHDERLQLWEAKYEKSIHDVNIEIERAKFSANPKRPKFRPMQ